MFWLPRKAGYLLFNTLPLLSGQFASSATELPSATLPCIRLKLPASVICCGRLFTLYISKISSSLFAKHVIPQSSRMPNDFHSMADPPYPTSEESRAALLHLKSFALWKTQASVDYVSHWNSNLSSMACLHVFGSDKYTGFKPTAWEHRTPTPMGGIWWLKPRRNPSCLSEFSMSKPHNTSSMLHIAWWCHSSPFLLPWELLMEGNIEVLGMAAPHRYGRETAACHLPPLTSPSHI